MTNAERIRSMSTHELAIALMGDCGFDCRVCPEGDRASDYSCDLRCEAHCEAWLEEEAEEEP